MTDDEWATGFALIQRNVRATREQLNSARALLTWLDTVPQAWWDAPLHRLRDWATTQLQRSQSALNVFPVPSEEETATLQAEWDRQQAERGAHND